MPDIASPARFAFGRFEIDLSSGELWKAGFRVKLQSQPFLVLTALIERPGEVITREELQLRVWGKHTTVDFDHSLGTAINKIREALGDSAENPRFVETLARRGYRFIAPVWATGSEIPPQISAQVPAHLHAQPPGNTAAGATSTSPAFTSAAVPASAFSLSASTEGGGVVFLPPGPSVPLAKVTNSLAGSTRSGVRGLRGAGGWMAIGSVALTSGLAIGYVAALRSVHPAVLRFRQVTHSGRIMPAPASMESFPATVTDGTTLFTSAIEGGRSNPVRVAMVGGSVQALAIPDEIASPYLEGISPDGSRLLLLSHLSNESEQPLWLVPVAGGSAQRIANTLAHAATWMPNGSDVLFAAGNELSIVHLGNGTVEPFASVPGRAFWLRWSPDGGRLRFTLYDPIAHVRSLWQLSAVDHSPKQLLKDWNEPADECCGVWTSDGSSFIFQSLHDGASDLWRLPGSADSTPRRLTDGPLTYQAPVATRSGQIFFTGVDIQSELQLYHPETRRFQPARTLFSDAERLEFTRDNQWLAWTDREGKLWRARANGTEKVQLTPDSVYVFLARWAPDGSRLALMAREPGKAWQIYIVRADGSALEHVVRESRNAGDPSWSPDGQSLVFGRVPDLMGKESEARTLQILDLRTRQIHQVPGSDDLFSPRWSPDGQYIVAMQFNQKRLMLFDTQTRQWKLLAERSVADPVWSADSRAVYAYGFMEAKQPIYRISAPAGNVVEVSTRGNFPSGDDTLDYFFCGLMPDSTPILRTRKATGNLYSLDLGR